METINDRLLACEEGIFNEEFPKKNKKRADRRKTNVNKALRKRNISKHALGWSWYNNLHQYSKNKIHCSCPWCRFEGLTMHEKRGRDIAASKIKEYLDEAV